MITNNIPQETINAVLIDILKGAKDASSEIYGASKTGIVKAVEFAQEQSPMVVQEFFTLMKVLKLNKSLTMLF